MDRRTFLSAAAASGLVELPSAQAASANSPRAGAALPPLKARLGHQLGFLTNRSAAWVARFGVDAIGASPVITDSARLYPTVDELNGMRDIAGKWKVKVELLDSAPLTASLAGDDAHPAILLNQGPERDRDIEAFQIFIKNCAAAGIRTLKYNLSILGSVRLEEVSGRGDSLNNRWNYQNALTRRPPLTSNGIVNADRFWEAIDYFLARVAPVAAQYKVRIACHPQDPGMPPEGYRGVDCVLGTIDGLKKFVGMHENPYHGLNFCQGTIAEDLYHPNGEIGDVIRWFGSRKKIFNVHFRNIRGRRDDFVAEIFPDEGDVDFVKALKVYREIGYEDLLMPDHAPQVAGRDAERGEDEDFAFEFGYIRGLIQAEKQLV